MHLARKRRTESRAPLSENQNPSSVSGLPLQTRNLTVSYGGRSVLRSVSFRLSSGTLTGIVGPNGAGKSTLLRAILGLIPIDTGEIPLFGDRIDKNRSRIAYVPQKQSVDWDFPVTVLDVVQMGRLARQTGWRRLTLWPSVQFGRPNAEDRQAAWDSLKKLGLDQLADRHIRQLSGGQQQRVFLARALCQQADIYLLDEPLTGVDAGTEETIFSLIDQLKKAAKTILLVSHDLSILTRMDQIMLLDRRIVAMGPPQQVATEENLRKTYGGRLSILDEAETELMRMK